MENNKYLTAFDIADILDVSKVTVYSWMKKGYLEFSLSGNLQRVTKENLLKYLKKIGNSDYAMKEFKHDIKFHFTEKALGEAKTPEEVKALREKDPKMFDDVLLNSKSHLPGNIVGAISGKDKDPFTKHPFEDSEEAKKYINEAKTPEEKTKRVAEVMNYEEGKGSKPWEVGK